MEKGITPDSWCQGSSRDDLVWAEWEDNYDIMEGLIESIEKQVHDVRYIFRAKERAKDIRIIFWFDN